ncbi:hypothetical protein Lupro_11640 [Lutibacter profundi]|uniref:Signal peptidase I n=1 Tax=Lutibacter profundi TaxID=1622118 RepID=A0A109RP28_9FLAO|nr:signal peptidase I [Lutibacter profundi]AMC11877.1 hypothetical protein Lupro_11640 [Lutibacter profundi]
MLFISSVLELLLLITGSIVFIYIYRTGFYIINKIKNNIVRNVVNTCFLLLFILTTIVSIKLVAFDIYKIPSVSMENTLFPDDIILVDKLKYGARLPRSPYEIPWVNLVFYFNDNGGKRIKENWWTYKRISGLEKIKRGDVFVFNTVSNKYDILVKRCVALAGDTLNIRNGRIYTNNKLFNSLDSEKNNYNFKITNKKKIFNIIDSLALNNYISIDNKINYGVANLSKIELEKLKKTNCIDSITIQIDTFNIDKKLFFNLSKKWTLDNMGPFVIPKKGMKINLNPETFSLYRGAINSSENYLIKEIDGIYYINNNKISTYTFKQNYYFMLGDNRKYSIDSRFWGFIPESNIIGKVQCVLFSNYQSNFQWGRLFKSVN